MVSYWLIRLMQYFCKQLRLSGIAAIITSVRMTMTNVCQLLTTVGEASITASILWTLHSPIASLLEARVEDTQECQHNHYKDIEYKTYVCTSISFNNFMNSSVTFNTLSMAHIFMISLELFM